MSEDSVRNLRLAERARDALDQLNARLAAKLDELADEGRLDDQFEEAPLPDDTQEDVR